MVFFTTKGINENHLKAESYFDLSSGSDHSPIIEFVPTNIINTQNILRLHSNKTK